MASGCPVAAAAAGSLPEVCGDAAMMFDPDDAADMARAILAARASGDRGVDRGSSSAPAFTLGARAWTPHVRVYAAVTDGRARAARGAPG